MTNSPRLRLLPASSVPGGSRQTPREALQEALARLRPDRVVGVVLNDHEAHQDSYRARAYHRYGMVYGARPPADGGDDVSGR